MRLNYFRWIYIFIIGLIILRLGYWQIAKADDLNAKADDQRLLTQQVLAPRGSIYFSDGSVLAANQPIYSLFLEPKNIDNWYEQTYKRDSSDDSIAGVGSLSDYKKRYSEKLAKVLLEEEERVKKEMLIQESTHSATLEEAEKQKEDELKALEAKILDKLNQNLYWVSLNRKVDLETKIKLEKMDFRSLGFDGGQTRFYPEGSSSAHLLGFMGSDIYGEETGYFGLEGFYNGELRGKKGFLTQEKDAQGIPILIGRFESENAKKGNDLFLSIDRSIQNIAEAKLKAGVAKYGAKSGSAIIMDPKTGNILAMASFPNFDPANPTLYPTEYYANPATNDSYEPGSTFKVLVMAAGINEGLVKRDTICDICEAPLDIGGFKIRTWNNEYTPNSTMDDVIIHSDNTGMVFVSRKLGIDKMYSYIHNFGFGSLTGIDLQGEENTDIREKSTWKEIDLATSSFGQGISVTPIQLIRGVATIANGGKLMEPHIVSSIKDSTGTHRIVPRVLGSPITEETAKTVTQMMVRAVSEGEAKFAKPKGYDIAGKTGTAQIPVAGHYDASKTIASFVGFAPPDDPKFIMLVRLVEPSSSIFGAETAAPIFFDISKDLFAYYGVAPTGQ